jgi:hypothetical protein
VPIPAIRHPPADLRAPETPLIAYAARGDCRDYATGMPIAAPPPAPPLQRAGNSLLCSSRASAWPRANRIPTPHG